MGQVFQSGQLELQLAVGTQEYKPLLPLRGLQQLPAISPHFLSELRSL